MEREGSMSLAALQHLTFSDRPHLLIHLTDSLMCQLDSWVGLEDEWGKHRPLKCVKSDRKSPY